MTSARQDLLAASAVGATGRSPLQVRPFKPYPAYKDSGVEWLGEIPAGWEVQPLKRVGDLQAGAGFPEDEQHVASEELPFFKVGDMAAEENKLYLNQCPSTVSHETARRLHAFVFPVNTIVFAKVGAALLLNRRRLLSRPSCIDNNMMGFTPRECHPKWALYWLSGLDLRELANPGAVPSVNEGQMRDIAIAVPPETEQRTIAAFLDRETAKIDALVAKKERLIELLQEQRTALITRAVTKGLDRNVPMKDSGVEWLGEIPAHWEVEENRWLFRESDVRSQLGEEELLTVSHITGVTRRSEKPDVTMIEAESHEGYKICGSSDLAINTMWAWMGALGIAREHGMVSPSYNVYGIGSDRLVPHYYDYLCRIPLHVAEIIRHSKGIWQSRLRLYPDAFRELLTPLPPTDEQRSIATFLDHETARIDALIAKIREAVERLKKYRTALISAAVTGKIDVRGTGAEQA